MACKRGAGISPLTKEQAQSLIIQTPLWSLAWEPSPPKITRKMVCRNFSAAVAFVNSAAAVMEEEGHHADIQLQNYREITLDLHTHSIQGLHRNDFVLAAKLDLIDVDYSPKFKKSLGELAKL